MDETELKKGEKAEERLRLYFLNLGYFVVRSIKAEFQGFDVTDIDLFLYARTSPISRERTNVDIKMKQRPQALERIFWTKGLQKVLGLEKCIVATTDNRSHVEEFGAINDVLVLNGNFINKLNSTERYSNDRLNEEDFLKILSRSELTIEWKKNYERSKSNLINKLNYDGLNEVLNEIKTYMSQLASGCSSEACYRILYASVSFFLITLDYAIKYSSYKSSKDRISIISNGIKFGENGRKKSEEIIGISTLLLESFINKGELNIEAIKQEIYVQFSDIPSYDISAYFGNSKMLPRLIHAAIEIEHHAFNKQFTYPSEMSSEIQSIIGIICDFYSFDRKLILL